MSLDEVGSLSVGQACFFASDLVAANHPAKDDEDGLASKQAVDDRWHDPAFREWYRARVDEAKRRARAGVAG
jgi:hypothetical protein